MPHVPPLCECVHVRARCVTGPVSATFFKNVFDDILQCEMEAATVDSVPRHLRPSETGFERLSRRSSTARWWRSRSADLGCCPDRCRWQTTGRAPEPRPTARRRAGRADRSAGAPGRARTCTGPGLSRLPLPVGLRGRERHDGTPGGVVRSSSCHSRGTEAGANRQAVPRAPAGATNDARLAPELPLLTLAPAGTAKVASLQQLGHGPRRGRTIRRRE